MAKIDAALDGKLGYTGKAYFFHGSQYVRYDWARGQVDFGPASIATYWLLPEPFASGIDAAINGEGAFEGKAYFFKGGQYVRYDWAQKQVDYGPVSIENWSGLDQLP